MPALNSKLVLQTLIVTVTFAFDDLHRTLALRVHSTTGEVDAWTRTARANGPDAKLVSIETEREHYDRTGAYGSMITDL